MPQMRGKYVQSGQRTKHSLRRTLVRYLMTGSLLPLVLVGILTYTSIYAILSNKIKSGISASLKQESANLENAINNLDFASKQFALDSQLTAELTSYLQDEQVFNRSQITASIEEKINLVNFTNPYLGVTAYIEPDASQPVLFSNLSIADGFDSTPLPSFIHYNGADYFGPHPTKFSSRSNMVISEMRAVRTDSSRSVFVYLETSYNLFRSILNEQSYGMKVAHVLVNGNGQTIYADDERLPDGVLLAITGNNSAEYETSGSYHLFRFTSSQGWQLVAAVSNSTFNSEMYAWFRGMILVLLATLAFAGFLAWQIWKQFYRPLHKVNVEILRMVENRTSPVSYTNVEEFDFVLSNFQEMKHQINGLIAAVEVNEKEKSRFEIEKLLSQINPHFLHNTLNTVQWLARMNGQKDIDKLVTLLIKVLHYNLGKQSLIVTVSEEIDALKNYMELQRIRYDYEFEFQLHVDEEALSAAIPRFLLQPLVENAIYHGTGDRSGQVEISITMPDSGFLVLRVEDNGAGMDPEAVQKLLTDDEAGRKRGLGIGLSYVFRMLKRYYGSRMTLDIDSTPGQGTAVTIRIPKLAREDFDD